MKNILKTLRRDEKGGAFVLTLVLLLIGGLILAPLLAHMGTGIIAGGVHERRMDELYAADAGVEDAIWKIQNPDNVADWPNPGCGDSPWDEPYEYDISDVNGKNVTVSVQYLGGGTHNISSIATGADGSTTTVNAVLSVLYVPPMDFSGLLDYAIASKGNITVQGGGPASPQIFGDVYISDKAHFQGNEACIQDPYCLYDQHQRSLTFPTFDQLAAYYWDDVKHLSPVTDNEIGVSGYTEDYPCVVSGLYVPQDGKLTIKGDGWLEVQGTAYIKGDLHLNGTPKIRVMLGDDAVFFVEGSITMDPSVPVGEGLSISGSGCIIAGGDVFLKPMASSNPDDFVLVLSLQGVASLLPMGTFQGTVAGQSGVTVSPLNTLLWTEWRDKNLNFPMGEGEDGAGLPISKLSIESWQIK